MPDWAKNAGLSRYRYSMSAQSASFFAMRRSVRGKPESANAGLSRHRGVTGFAQDCLAFVSNKCLGKCQNRQGRRVCYSRCPPPRKKAPHFHFVGMLLGLLVTRPCAPHAPVWSSRLFTCLLWFRFRQKRREVVSSHTSFARWDRLHYHVTFLTFRA